MPMGRKVRLAIVTGAAVAVVLSVAGWSIADDGTDEQPIEGPALERAERAALAETGGGTVVETEADGDAESYYEVEVATDDGRQVEVELDENFQVLGSEEDDDAGSDE